MRIAILALHFAEYAGRLAVALSTKHEVLLVLPSGNANYNELPDDLRALLNQTVTVRSLELPRLRDPRVLRTIFSINRILREFSPEILHVQEAASQWNAWAILSFRRHIPIVLTIHDHTPHSGEHVGAFRRWVGGLLRCKVHRVIVHGPRIQAEMEVLDKRVAGRIDVIPHGVLGTAVASDDVSGYEPGTFLFFGRIEVYKGLGDLLDACQVLRDRGRAFRLIVAGRGSDLNNHRERIASSPWVSLTDRYISAKEIPDLFRRASVVVLPYTDATQSGVGAMAFAFTRPVIATRTGDVPDIVIDGQTGLLVPPRDPNALADAMEKLLLDCRLRDSLATGAARFAKEALSWVRIADMTCDTYRRAIGEVSVNRRLA